MTLRDAGAAAITLMGLYFASRVVALYFALMLTPYLVSPEAFSTSDPALATSISSAVGSLAVAVLAIAGARRISALLFPALPIPGAWQRLDLLFVGIALLGLWVTLDALVALARAAGAYVYLSRQHIPAASLERSWPQALANLFSVAAGIAVTLGARAMAASLDPPPNQN